MERHTLHPQISLKTNSALVRIYIARPTYFRNLTRSGTYLKLRHVSISKNNSENSYGDWSKLIDERKLLMVAFCTMDLFQILPTEFQTTRDLEGQKSNRERQAIKPWQSLIGSCSVTLWQSSTFSKHSYHCFPRLSKSYSWVCCFVLCGHVPIFQRLSGKVARAWNFKRAYRQNT